MLTPVAEPRGTIRPPGPSRPTAAMPAPAPVQLVYFDLGNVICPFDRERSLRQASSVSGASLEQVRAALMDERLQGALERGTLDWAGFHAEFSRRTGTACDGPLLAEAASDMFTLNIDLLPVIAGLARIGCRAGILSNTCAIHWEHLVRRGYAVLPGRFDPIVLSHEAGAIKPEPAIYATAARLAGVPGEAIFFCDDLEANVAGARAAGWQAERFTTAAALVESLWRRGLDLGI